MSDYSSRKSSENPLSTPRVHKKVGYMNDALSEFLEEYDRSDDDECFGYEDDEDYDDIPSEDGQESHIESEATDELEQPYDYEGEQKHIDPEEHRRSTESFAGKTELEEFLSLLETITSNTNGDAAQNGFEQAHRSHEDMLSEPAGQTYAEIPESIGTASTSDKVQLAKTVKDGIDRCKQALEQSKAKLEHDIDDANQSFTAENDLINEWHERIKKQELILDKRKEIHVRLPTNQVVTPAHNALVEEDAKEGILIADSFSAIKAEKACIRDKLAGEIEKAEETYRKDCATLSVQIACFCNVAELFGIDLDTDLDEYTFYEPAAPVIRVQSSVQAQGPTSTRPRQSTTANANKRQRPTVPVNVVEDNCSDCGRLQEELLTARKKIERIQAAAPVPDMRKFIKHGEQILSELVQQRDSAAGVAAKERLDKQLSTETALEDLANEHARMKKIHTGIGHLWEHENQNIWQETFDLCRAELVRIKKEQQALENLDFRCEEKMDKRQWDSKQLLIKQIKFYDSLLRLARSHVVNHWGDRISSDSDSD
ncbi:hypothetical protein ACET3X_000182 [Alternaria dauci]|uniref:Uncharacterized protein n=1 Tax=Alternaria dauci TaxID=48095 RepID=A0ABR3UU63_9PLEO